jgi:hypothetical protein
MTATEIPVTISNTGILPNKLQHLSAECRLLLKTAKNLVEVNVLEDPTYHVADDKLA